MRKATRKKGKPPTLLGAGGGGKKKSLADPVPRVWRMLIKKRKTSDSWHDKKKARIRWSQRGHFGFEKQSCLWSEGKKKSATPLFARVRHHRAAVLPKKKKSGAGSPTFPQRLHQKKASLRRCHGPHGRGGKKKKKEKKGGGNQSHHRGPTRRTIHREIKKDIVGHWLISRKKRGQRRATYAVFLKKEREKRPRRYGGYLGKERKKKKRTPPCSTDMGIWRQGGRKKGNSNTATNSQASYLTRKKKGKRKKERDFVYVPASQIRGREKEMPVP